MLVVTTPGDRYQPARATVASCPQMILSLRNVTSPVMEPARVAAAAHSLHVFTGIS
jgi:hypothetical protein